MEMNTVDETLRKSPSTMDCLPVELQQEILTQLTPLDLARLRCASTIHRNIVNYSLDYVSRQLCFPAISRLRDYVGYHFDSRNIQIDFLESLRRFIAHRRYGPPHTGPIGLANDFVEHWIDQHDGVLRRTTTTHTKSISLDSSGNDSEGASMRSLGLAIWALKRLVNMMMSIHTQYHASPGLWGLWPYGSRTHDSLADRTMLTYLEACGIDETMLRRWETDLVDHGLANLQRDARQQEFLHGPGCDEDGIPKYALTPLNVRWTVKPRPWTGNTSYVKSDRTQRIHGLCSVSKLVAILGVPPLAENGPFAYCVESRCAFEQMRRAVESGEEIDGLVKAMVLKETFVF